MRLLLVVVAILFVGPAGAHDAPACVPDPERGVCCEWRPDLKRVGPVWCERAQDAARARGSLRGLLGIGRQQIAPDGPRKGRSVDADRDRQERVRHERHERTDRPVVERPTSPDPVRPTDPTPTPTDPGPDLGNPGNDKPTGRAGETPGPGDWGGGTRGKSDADKGRKSK